MLHVGFVLLTVIAFFHACHGRATFKDNGYDKVLVVIDNSMTDDPKLLENLQSLISQASEHLYTATKGRAYFRNVEILVPSAWSADTKYEVAGEQSYQIADVIVAPENPNYHEQPYVSQPGNCGDPGRYVHLAADFISTNRKNPTLTAKTLVQNWIKYRYGVYDESAPNPKSASDVFTSEYRPFYPSGDNGDDAVSKFQPSVCGALTGQIKHEDGSKCKIVNSWIDHECRFIPNAEQQINSSLMYTAEIEGITDLCEDKGHNAHNINALNEQNDKCNYRSIWSVLLQHPDFQNFVATDNYKTSKPARPSFTIMQPTTLQRIVYVLDTSSSMDGCPMANMLQATKASISVLALPVELGIVHYSNFVRTLMNSTRLETIDDIGKALEKLPKRAAGMTCIHCGVKNGLEVLQGGTKQTKGSTILLLGDGEENLFEVMTIIPQVEKAGIVVNTVAVGLEASEKFTAIAERTGGSSFFVPNACGAGVQYVASMITASLSAHDTIVLAKEIVIPTKPGQTLTGQFVIDSSVGINTRITLIYENKNTGMHFNFIDANGGSYLIAPPAIPLQDTLLKDGRLRVVPKRPDFKVESIPAGGVLDVYEEAGMVVLRSEHIVVGVWKYEITKGSDSTASEFSNGSISIISQAPPNQQALQLVPYPSKVILDMAVSKRMVIYAALARGSTPVLHAKVTAAVARETILANLTLSDDGRGSDSKANDGVYSADFIDFVASKEKITYSVSVTAVNTDKTVYPMYGKSDQSTGPFRRDAETLFEVVNAESPPPPSPGRVKDLRVDSFNEGTRKIILVWTAPGGERDYGVATAYEFVASSKLYELVPDVTDKAKILKPTNSSKPLVKPGPFGKRQKLVVVVKSIQSGPIFVRMRAVNQYGVKGEWSNWASTLVVSKPVVTTTAIPTTTAATPTTTAATPAATEASTAAPTEAATEASTEADTPATTTTSAEPDVGTTPTTEEIPTEPTTPIVTATSQAPIPTEEITVEPPVVQPTSQEPITTVEIPTEPTTQFVQPTSQAPISTEKIPVETPSVGITSQAPSTPKVIEPTTTALPLPVSTPGPTLRLPVSTPSSGECPQQAQGPNIIPKELFDLIDHGKVVFEVPLKKLLEAYCEKGGCSK